MRSWPAEVTVALGHDWGETVFNWTEVADGYTATATRTCKNDENHKQTETATVTSKVTKEPTSTATGIITWTATVEFDDGATATATKEVELPKLQLSYTISGTVMCGADPVSNAQVKLVPTDITVTTDTDGKFTFNDVSIGIYNLVITSENGTTKTVLVTVTDSGLPLSRRKWCWPGRIAERACQ